MFVEGGEVRITEPSVKGVAPAPAVLKSGEFYARKADQKGALAATPAAELRLRAAEDHFSIRCPRASRVTRSARSSPSASRR